MQDLQFKLEHPSEMGSGLAFLRGHYPGRISFQRGFLLARGNMMDDRAFPWLCEPHWDKDHSSQDWEHLAAFESWLHETLGDEWYEELYDSHPVENLMWYYAFCHAIRQSHEVN